jgi:signal transduction histidine kinase
VRRGKLYTRIYLHFIGVLLVVGFTSSMVFATGWRVAFLRAWTVRLARHAASMVAAQPDAQRRDQMVHHLADELDLDITVRDPNGAVQISTGDLMPALNPEEARETREGPTIFHHGRNWFVAAPIYDRQTGAAIGVVETFPMRRFAPANLLRPLLTVAFALLMVGIATFPLARRISRPVERLTEASRRLGEGDLGYRVPLPGCEEGDGPRQRFRRWRARRRAHRQHIDELGDLTRAWNDMAERVEGLVRGQRELLTNVSHELRSPLARIRVALELLPEDERSKRRIDDVKVDLAELERLIDDVLTSSRLDATGLPAHIARVDVPSLLAGLIERAKADPLTAGKPVTLGPGATEAGELAADGALLKRALWNLIENAAKYGAPPITLTAERTADRLLLTVADEGDGIAPEDRARVFDPFFRADKARTPGRAQGFGLGLTLARRIAEVHGGTIRLAALTTPGCRITLDLPLK